MSTAADAGIGPRSLGTQLLSVLAVQIFAGLAFVSIVVYLMISSHFDARQAAALARLEAFVVHIASEARSSTNASAFDHVLRDFFIGRDDIALELHGEQGVVRYGSLPPAGSSTEIRRLAFLRPVPAGSTRGEFDLLEARFALDTSDDDLLLTHLAWTLALTSLLGALVGSAGAALFVRRGFEPIADLANQLRELDASNLGTRLSGEVQPAELQPLVAHFNELLDRLDGVNRQLRAFNANVAHELKTPLATLVTTTELGLRGSGDAAALRELLASSLEELERLDGVVRSMLFLSTAQRGTRARTSTITSLAALARDVVEYHEAVFEHAGLTSRVIGDSSVEGDVMLLREALSNLLSNATRHAKCGSKIDISISTEPGSALLTVANIGETVPSEVVEHFFERFYRSEPSLAAPPISARSAQSGPPRHGLGLPIVAAIARMHRGIAFAESSHGRTAVGFTLRTGTTTSDAG